MAFGKRLGLIPYFNLLQLTGEDKSLRHLCMFGHFVSPRWSIAKKLAGWEPFDVPDSDEEMSG